MGCGGPREDTEACESLEFQTSKTANCSHKCEFRHHQVIGTDVGPVKAQIYAYKPTSNSISD